MFAVAHKATDRGISARSIAVVDESKPKVSAPIISLEAEAERIRLSVIEQRRADGLRQFRRWGMPDWAAKIVSEVSDKHAICPSDIAGRRRFKAIVDARREAIYRVKATKPSMSCIILGRWFNRDHTSVTHLTASYSEATGAPKVVGYDISKTRARYVKRRDAAKAETP
jgi:chromosomal replication initiation ATPase DnaA